MGWDPNARCDECIHAHPTQLKDGMKLCRHPRCQGYSEVMSPKCNGEHFIAIKLIDDIRKGGE